jgi:hypothetical protein
VEQKLGGSGEEWHHAVSGREGGGLAAVTHEQWSRVAFGRCCSIEQGSRGRRHVGPRPQYWAER